MKQFLRYFKDFHQDYFSKRLYFSVALFIALLITFNYILDFEDSYIDKDYGKIIRILWFFLIHGFAYYGTLFLIRFYDKKNVRLSSTFWIKSAIALLIIGIDRASLPFFSDWFIDDRPNHIQRFFYMILSNAYGWVTVVLFLFFVKQIFDRKNGEGLYGLRFSNVNFKAYLLMLLIMIPILLCATLIPDIMDYYPTYKRVGGLNFANYFHVKQWVSVVIYETFYLTDFFSIELIFRGFLVIGLSKILGKDAILPMVATYCVLHFGKPMGEAISSAFGGYVLGIIALYSRNIWGGVFLHGGIAFFMELFAFWRR